jgi:hypothetical protein
MRDFLFPRIEFVPLVGQHIHPDQFPKVAAATQQAALVKATTVGDDTIGDFLSRQVSAHFVFYEEATRYWVKATVGLPHYAKNGVVGAPAHGRYLQFGSRRAAHAACAVLNSSLFYVYFITYGDCIHLSDGLATSFPVNDAIMADKDLAALGSKLMADLRANAVTKTINTRDGDEITYAEFYASKSKPLIDEIDRIHSRHYGFTAEELDFVMNYDAKFRLAADGVEGDGA